MPLPLLAIYKAGEGEECEGTIAKVSEGHDVTTLTSLLPAELLRQYRFSCEKTYVLNVSGEVSSLGLKLERYIDGIDLAWHGGRVGRLRLHGSDSNKS